MKIKIFEDVFVFQRVDRLIRTRATGTPKLLATRLGVSECSVYRLIELLKDQGLPIAYDKFEHTYYYTAQVHWNVEFTVGSEKILSFKGG